MMLTGVVGNALAMLLVSRSYRAKGSRRKRSFLLCIGSLALTDMLGQLLTSPIVISVYLSGRPWASMDPSGRLCGFFGFSMTVCCAASHMSPRATERGLAAIWAAGVAFALLPLAGLGRYALQWPGTWCFISTAGRSAFAAAFAALGLLSLVVTGACNLATIGALVARCRAKAGGTGPGSRWGRITTETLLQLLGIMCVLAGCWSPLLVTMLRVVSEQEAGPPRRELLQECDLSLTAVRLASLNQILDPWVYLLLRRILLRRLCQAASAVSRCSNAECKDRAITLSLSEEIRRTAA
ncbi:PE2R3 protein, partial [Thryothorus ludovicianus]|nr:PE2R3 protein [Thryothorus ludovicianus]